MEVEEGEIEEAEIDLERALKVQQLLSTFLKDTAKSAEAAAEAAQINYLRSAELYKQGALSHALLDAGRARFDEATARHRQLYSIMNVVLPTPNAKVPNAGMQ